MRRVLAALILSLAACYHDPGALRPDANAALVVDSAQDSGPIPDFWCYGDGVGITCFYGDGALTQCQSDPTKPLDASCAPF